MALSTTELIKALREAFRDQNIVLIDAIKLEEGIGNTYTLCVVTPSLVNEEQSKKSDIIIHLLFKTLDVEVRRMISNVNTFDSIEHMENPDKIDLNIGKTFKV